MGEAADCPPCIRNWTGSKALFWSLDLEDPNSSKVYRDLAWMKAFIVSEQFSWVPDPLHDHVLLGLDMQAANPSTLSQEILGASYKPYSSLVEAGRQSTCNSIENLEIVERHSSTLQEVKDCQQVSSQRDAPIWLGTLQNYLALIRDDKPNQERISHPSKAGNGMRQKTRDSAIRKAPSATNKLKGTRPASCERVSETYEQYQKGFNSSAEGLGSSRGRIPRNRKQQVALQQHLKQSFSRKRSSKASKSPTNPRKRRSLSHIPRRYSTDSTATRVTQSKDIRMHLQTSIDLSQLIRLKAVSPIAYQRFLTPQKKASKPWDRSQQQLSLTWQGFKHGLFDRHRSDPRAGPTTSKKRPRSQSKNLLHYAIPGFSPKLKFSFFGG